MKKNNIAILVPIGKETGGPEALHQLCDSLRKHNQNAFLVPSKNSESNAPVAAYEKYNAPIDTHIPKNTKFVIPEDSPHEIRTGNTNFLWWLSVDNSPLSGKRQNPYNSEMTTELLHNIRKENVIHLAQSYYAKKFLKNKFQIQAAMLTDYISRDFFNFQLPKEKNLITTGFKGVEFYKQICDELPWLKIERLDGISRNDVIYKLASSKLYIDFGNQPGRDRMPREAAILKSHVLTNRKGAGGIFRDVPLSKNAKIDSANIRESVETILNWISRPSKPSLTQKTYRRWIQLQEQQFTKEVKKMIDMI